MLPTDKIFLQEETNDVQEPKKDAPTKIPIKNKKIKKRCRYRSITDKVRQTLIEAVVHNGEMLKMAAERLNINYSSAKSIFHTYKREGRMLKKVCRNRAGTAKKVNLPSNTVSLSTIDMSPTNSATPKSFQDSFQGSLSSLSNLTDGKPSFSQHVLSQESLCSNFEKLQFSNQGFKDFNVDKTFKIQDEKDLNKAINEKFQSLKGALFNATNLPINQMSQMNQMNNNYQAPYTQNLINPYSLMNTSNYGLQQFYNPINTINPIQAQIMQQERGLQAQKNVLYQVLQNQNQNLYLQNLQYLSAINKQPQQGNFL